MNLIRRIAALFIVALLVRGYSGTAAAANDPIADLDAFIARTLQQYQVPGAAVAVVRDGKVALVKANVEVRGTAPGILATA